MIVAVSCCDCKCWTAVGDGENTVKTPIEEGGMNVSICENAWFVPVFIAISAGAVFWDSVNLGVLLVIMFFVVV